MVLTADNAITFAAVNIPLFAILLEACPVICHVCPTFPTQAVAILKLSVGTTYVTSPTSVEPEIYSLFFESYGCMMESSGFSKISFNCSSP